MVVCLFLSFCLISPLLSVIAVPSLFSHPFHPPLPVVPFFLGHCVLPFFFLFPHCMQHSVSDERNCISAQCAVGSLKYLIKTTFVWREPRMYVRGRDLTDVCLSAAFICRGGRKTESRVCTVYLCMWWQLMKACPYTVNSWLSLLRFLYPTPPLFPGLPYNLILLSLPHLITIMNCIVLCCMRTMLFPPYCLVYLNLLCMHVWLVCACVLGWFQGAPQGPPSSIFHHRPDTAEEKRSSLLFFLHL